MNRIALAASLSLALFACRGDDGGGTTDGGGSGGDGSNAGDVTIQEIQNDAMASGTAVEVKGVVVTAIDSFGNRTGDLFVSEPGGGAFSGVKVFGTPLDTLATLQVGDLVDITGAEKHEACNAAAPCGPVVFDNGASITEIQGVAAGSLVITKVGTMPVPTPSVVDAKAVAAMTAAERVAEWEKWEGVLIKVTNARQLSAVAQFGNTPGDDSNEFRITGIARVQSVLVGLPVTATFGTCYESVTGIGDFFFNNLILPRTADDLVAGGTMCRPSVATVSALQSSTEQPELVNLTNVVVTARDDIGGTSNPATSKGIWVQDALQGAANNGVYVFTNMAAAAGLVPGVTCDISGGVDEFDLGSGQNPPAGDTITEVSSPTITNISATASGTPLPATGATVETLGTIGAAGEPWEGVLVRIGPVKVSNVNAGGNRAELTDNNAKKIQMGRDAFAYPVQTAGACLQITGVMSVAIFDDVRTINPRDAADITTTTGCTP